MSQIKTLQEDWRSYRDTCYKLPLPPGPRRELHQAFFAGEYAALMSMQMIAHRVPDETEAAAEAGKLCDEAEAMCLAHAQSGASWTEEPT